MSSQAPPVQKGIYRLGSAAYSWEDRDPKPGPLAPGQRASRVITMWLLSPTGLL